MNIVSRYEATPWFYSDTEKVTGIITSDWHIADKYAPLPDQACTKEGQTIKPSKFQRKVKKELIERLKEIGKVDVLIINGDAAEGKQLKSFGVPINDADTDTQGEWAFQFYEETFYKYCNPDKVIMTMGTPYHVMVGIGGNLDYQIADKINRISDVTFGYPVIQFYLGKGKMLWDVRHRVSIATVNRLMPLEKTYRMFYRECIENGFDVPDVVGRAHNHGVVFAPTNVSMGKRKMYGWHSPCLKGSDVYGETLSYPSSPKLGVLTFNQDERKLSGDYYPLSVDGRRIEKQ